LRCPPPRNKKHSTPNEKRKIKGRRAVSATPNKIKSSDAAVCVKTLNEKQIGPEQKLRLPIDGSIRSSALLVAVHRRKIKRSPKNTKTDQQNPKMEISFSLTRRTSS
jgi:hypothetical protein